MPHRPPIRPLDRLSLRLRVTLAFLVCTTLVLGVLGTVGDQQLAQRLTAARDQQVNAGLDRLGRALPDPAWFLNTPQVKELLLAEMAGNRHLAWVAVRLAEDGPVVVTRNADDRLLTGGKEPPPGPGPILRRDLLQPDSTRRIGVLSATADNRPMEEERRARRLETAAWIVVLDVALALLAWAVIGQLVNRRLDPLARRLASSPEAAAHVSGDELARLAAGADALLMRLATVLDAIGDGVVTIDDGLRVERCNPEARRLLGAAAQPGAQLAAAFAAHPDAAAFAAQVREKVLVRSETMPPREPLTLGSRRVAVGVSPVPGGHGGGGAVLVLRDLTEQLAAAERLQQALRLESIGKLAGGIAHDSNNLLTVIVGAAELLARTADAGARRRHVDTILSTAAQAAEFNRKLLAFARRDPVRRDVLDLHQVVTEAETLLSHSLDKRIELVVERCPGPLVVAGDRTALVNALLNLGINARDAMPGGGRLRLSTMPVTLAAPEDATGGGALAAGGYACLLVSDEGSGIAAEHLDRLFEPFFTTKAVGSGTGLGLAAVLGTIRSHGGSISASSPGPGRGATFRLLLPLSSAPLPAAAPPPAADGLWRGSGTLLFIDDDPVVRMVGQKLLEGLGFTVLTAANGRQGLEVHAQHQPVIRAVLLDLMMPVMGGAECFTALRARDPAVKVVFVSGFAGEIDLEKLLAEGSAVWLRKPFQLDQLVAVLRQVL